MLALLLLLTTYFAEAMELPELHIETYVPTLKALCIHRYLNHKHGKYIREQDIETLSIPPELKELFRAYKRFERSSIEAQIPIFIALNDLQKIDAALHFIVRKKITTKDHVKKFTHDLLRPPPNSGQIAFKYYSEVRIPFQDWQKYQEYIEDEKLNYIRKRKKYHTRLALVAW